MKIIDVYSQFHNKIDMNKISPSYKPLLSIEKKKNIVRLGKIHVRKQNFKVYDLFSHKYTERIAPLPEHYKNIFELSTRAPFCPLPFNFDVGIGICPFGCIYCFTSLTISSLMTAFFDSPTPFKPRFAKPEYLKKQMKEILDARGVEPYERLDIKNPKVKNICGNLNSTYSMKKAASQRIPLRIGNRFENFLPIERRLGITKLALEILKDYDYPTIINTKSDLILQEPYFSLISSFGKNIAIQVSLIHTDDDVAKRLEPNAPPSSKRWEVIKAFNEVGINALPRMEPCAYGINGSDEHLIRYMDKAKECGVKNFVLDAWHHTVKAEEIRLMFYNKGFDFDKMWYGSSEYQIVGSYIVEKAMYYAKQRGIKSGTFNYHSIPYNDSNVCCMVDNLHKKYGNFNQYSLVNIMKSFIIGNNKPVTFEEIDNKLYGRELHPLIYETIKKTWNLYSEHWASPYWVEGLIPIGKDGEGNLIWQWQPHLVGEGYKALMKIYPNGVKE